MFVLQIIDDMRHFFIFCGKKTKEFWQAYILCWKRVSDTTIIVNGRRLLWTSFKMYMCNSYAKYYNIYIDVVNVIVYKK